MSSKRPPPWATDEIILALEMYFSGVSHSPQEPKVVELSELLKNLPCHGEEAKVANFRSPNSVSMKLMNFRALDPEYKGVGLKSVSKEDRNIWNEFANKRDALKDIAHAIREHARKSQPSKSSKNYKWPENEPITEAPEGKMLTREHLVRERSRKLVKAKKESVLKKTGKLACEACGFDFAERYGEERGGSFIECHHNKPLRDLKPGDKTRLDDLSLLCSNCHRMIHVRRPWLEVEELILLLDSMSEI